MRKTSENCSQLRKLKNSITLWKISLRKTISSGKFQETKTEERQHNKNNKVLINTNMEGNLNRHTSKFKTNEIKTTIEIV